MFFRIPVLSCPIFQFVYLKMLQLILDTLLFAFLARKRTPLRLVVGISALVLVALIMTVIKQADYIR